MVSSEKGRRVTLKDIAKRLDLSHATISRALNSTTDPLISEATKERVRQAALEMGYRPNHAARSLATGRTGLICLWLWAEGSQSAYHNIVARAMHGEALSRSYQLLIDLVNRPSIELAAQHIFDPWHVDGAIVHEAAPAIEAQVHKRGPFPVPLVSTGTYHLLRDVDRVCIDISQGARMAMEHLMGSGRKRIAYVTSDLEGSRGDARHQVYAEMLGEAGMQNECIRVPHDRATTRQLVREYVQEKGAPDALYCHNDDMAIASYCALRDLGIRIPDDVAIVGCDGIEDTEYLDVPITTIALPIAEMCSTACQFLEQRIEDPSLPLQEARLTAQLIIRQSSGGEKETVVP